MYYTIYRPTVKISDQFKAILVTLIHFCSIKLIERRTYKEQSKRNFLFNLIKEKDVQVFACYFSLFSQSLLFNEGMQYNILSYRIAFNVEDSTNNLPDGDLIQNIHIVKSPSSNFIRFKLSCRLNYTKSSCEKIYSFLILKRCLSF